MSRLLAIDYGTKRTGIAVTDPLKIIAAGLITVPTYQLFDFLDNYFRKEEVEGVVIGLPKQLNNQPSENMRYVEIFVKKFQIKYPSTPIVYYDERFTSKIAHRIIVDSGLKKKDRQRKELVDEISATIILRDYMDSNIYKHKDK